MLYQSLTTLGRGWGPPWGPPSALPGAQGRVMDSRTAVVGSLQAAIVGELPTPGWMWVRRGGRGKKNLKL
jgi:hypothetical protein